MLTLSLFALGLLLTVKGADWFTGSAVWMATVTRIPEVIIGATVVSLATTLPEFSVSAYAAYSSHSGLALGNAIGSNIANIGLILGASVLLRAISLEPRLLLSEGLFMVFAGFTMLFLVRDGVLSGSEGWLLFLLLAAYIYYTVTSARKERNKNRVPGTNSDRTSKEAILLNLGKFGLGIAAVILGSRLMVQHGAQIARILGVPEMVIGLSLVAIGTSMPELITALTCVFKGHQGLSVGNIIGANFLNMTWVLGGSALIRPLPVSDSLLKTDLPIMMLFMAALLLFGARNGKLERWKGAALLAGYAVYVLALFS